MIICRCEYFYLTGVHFIGALNNRYSVTIIFIEYRFILLQIKFNFCQKRSRSKKSSTQLKHPQKLRNIFVLVFFFLCKCRCRLFKWSDELFGTEYAVSPCGFQQCVAYQWLGCFSQMRVSWSCRGVSKRRQTSCRLLPSKIKRLTSF